MHVHDEITGEKLSSGLAFLALLNLGHAFGGNEHLINEIAHLLRFHPLNDVVAHLVLLPGENMDYEPLIFACEGLGHNQRILVKK
jgi:hypothetical protein